MYSVAFYTLGCRLNQAETAIVAETFRTRGYEVCEFGAPTDVCVINTCSVTGQSEAHCRNIIRQVLRRQPATLLAVVGCYAQVGLEAVRAISGVDLIVGTEQKFELVDHVDRLLAVAGDGRACKLQESHVIRSAIASGQDFTLPATGNFVAHTRANIKIQDGCDFFCAYCIVPHARGRDRSRLFEDIRREAGELARRGHREIVITGVNIGTYASGGNTLLDVIKMLEDLDGLDRVRLTSIEPMTIPAGMIDYLARSTKLCHFFHIPLQSGDNTILQRMNRRYTREDFSDFVMRLTAAIPDIGIGTDVIVGFPGEGEAEFERSRQMLADLPLMYAHVFSFSPRQGTPAARFADRVAPDAIKARSQALRDLSKEKRQAFYARFIGKQAAVLFERRTKNGLFTGYTGNYIKVGVATPTELANQICDVTIVETREKLAIGRISA
jgi:threonylcarbamoyladenosine tRNA methylthiotransferase MtaB